jgi:uridylate kinase
MTKQNALIKISGSLLKDKKAIEQIKKISKKYFTVILIGGGEQINKAFKKKGWKIKFGPLGRITKTFEQKQLARDVLEKNQEIVQDMLDELGIGARVIIPVDEVASVICHVNGDIMVLSAYNGFDRIFMFTPKNNVEKKKKWLKQLADCFKHIDEGDIDKIEVVGF